MYDRSAPVGLAWVGRRAVTDGVRWPHVPLATVLRLSVDAHRREEVAYYLPLGWYTAVTMLLEAGARGPSDILDGLEVLCARLGAPAARILCQEGPDVYLTALRALGADVTRRP